MELQTGGLSRSGCQELILRIGRARDPWQATEPAMVCKIGDQVLKLQKPIWTNDDMSIVPNRSGIFFSIWWDNRSDPVLRMNYNIHALKLRQLRGFKITSRDFARDFRQRFESEAPNWPNASTDFGPLTLMQGWINVAAATIEADVTRLMKHFMKISPIIDELLEARRYRTHVR